MKPITSTQSITAVAHPSLALVKYWGKLSDGVNIPATSSIGVTLSALTTRTTVTLGTTDSLVIDDIEQPKDRYLPFYEHLRSVTKASHAFAAISHNNFPTAAGLASSASGYAALTVAALAACGDTVPGVSQGHLSRVARFGSGSAARSIFGGFVAWERGREEATQLFGPDWWPEIRIVVLPLSSQQKPISSRVAMNRTRDTSPFYSSWVEDAEGLYRAAKTAIQRRDIEALGDVARLSYLRMFGTMLSADPPILFWQNRTVEAIHRVAALRGEGVAAWETIDAGPQVKVLTTEGDADRIVQRCTDLCSAPPIVTTIGGDAEVIQAEEGT